MSSSSCTMALLSSRNWLSSAGPNFLARATLTKWLNCFQHSMWVSIWLTSWLSCLAVIVVSGWRVRGLREKENDGAAAQFAGGDAEAAEMDADFGERHLGGAGFAEQNEDVLADLVEQCLRIGARNGG